MKKMQEKGKIYKAKHQLPIKPSNMDGKHQSPQQISKLRRIKGFGENVSQLPLCVYVSMYLISMSPFST
jgi:hypothetical protein